MKQRVVRVILGVAAAAMAGCGDMRATDTGRSTSTITGTTATASPIIGTWSFTRYFTDDAGNAHLSQTVWRFASGGFASKTLYSDNLTAGVGDVITQSGHWTTSGGSVKVTFDDGSSPVSYDYHFDGADILVLAGTSFIRLQ